MDRKVRCHKPVQVVVEERVKVGCRPGPWNWLVHAPLAETVLVVAVEEPGEPTEASPLAKAEV